MKYDGTNLDEVLEEHRKWLSEEGGSKAYLSRAYLSRADLSGADLSGADLRWADLIKATMPDGRKWEEYRLDHYAGICDSDEVRAKAGAAWGSHTWKNCPMHKALGISSTEEAGEKAKLVGCWVALYDSDVLPEPKDASDA